MTALVKSIMLFINLKLCHMLLLVSASLLYEYAESNYEKTRNWDLSH